MSKLQIDIALYTLHSEYVASSHSVRSLLTLKSLIKEVIGNLGIYSEKLKFVSIYAVYEGNTGATVVVTSTSFTPTSKQIDVKYHCFRQIVGKEFCIWNIESENKMADIFTTGFTR